MSASPRPVRPSASLGKGRTFGTRASHASPESGTPGTHYASLRPGASRVRPEQRTHFRDEDRDNASRAFYRRDAGRGPSGDAGLTPWLADLKARQLTINTGPDGPTIGGRNLHLVTPDDTHQLTRHHHALQTAATGTHPTWWNWASGRDRTTVPQPDDLPWTCATCGTPECPHLDADLLAFCDQHWSGP